MSAERVDRYAQLARDFAVDAFTAEVAGAFGLEGMETLVLKGPVLARWLYPGEVRPYVDCDLMVAPGNQARAVGVLGRLGFVEHLPWMPTPLSLDPGGTAFNRPGEGMVDLHCQLQGSTVTRMQSGSARCELRTAGHRWGRVASARSRRGAAACGSARRASREPGGRHNMFS